MCVAWRVSRCVTANTSLSSQNLEIIEDGDDACWFAGLDTGVKCLQRRDAWSVHTKGFRRPCVIGPR